MSGAPERCPGATCALGRTQDWIAGEGRIDGRWHDLPPGHAWYRAGEYLAHEATADTPAFNAAWQEVTCRGRGREYTCTPEDDYYGPPDGGLPESATDGVCFGCQLRRGGLDPEVTPARVINLTGTGTSDPRDLSRNLATGGES